MKINLKDLAKDKEMLKYVQSVMRNHPILKPMSRKMDKIVKLFEEIETDLELSAECIIELDKGRLESIEEKNKMLKTLTNEDDI